MSNQIHHPTTINFIEKQSFKNQWLAFILVVIDLGFIYVLFAQLYLKMSIGNNPLSNVGLLFMGIFLLVLNLFLFSVRLSTHINNEGIHFQLFPFHLKDQHLKWEDIASCRVEQYNPVIEFGGWGLRYNLKTKAYTISGDWGLRITTKENKHFLIGTKKPVELKAMLEK